MAAGARMSTYAELLNLCDFVRASDADHSLDTRHRQRCLAYGTGGLDTPR